MTNSPTAEVTNISPFGFWILVNDSEYFVSYEDYPSFADATILDIASVKADCSGNLHWPTLNEDIETDALARPDAYPLVYKQ